MHDEEQFPIFSKTNRGIATIFVRTGVFNPHERIEENLASTLEADTVLRYIGRRLFLIPENSWSRKRK